MTRTRVAPPEFWRFFFILFICFLHFEEDVYDKVHLIANAGYLGVDFFLLLSGFVVSMNHHISPINSVFQYTIKRVKKIYPDFLFAIILMFVLWLLLDNENGVLGIAGHIFSTKYQFVFANAFYPVELEMRSIWFLSYWLVGIIILATVLKRNYLRLAGVVALSFMSWHVFNKGSLFNDSAIPEFLWSVRLIKCVSQVIIGALAFDAYLHLKDIKFSKLGKFVLSAIEIASVLFVIFIMAKKGRNLMDYEVCIAFIIIIILSFLNNTFLSRILDNRLSVFLGKLSLPIYLYHLFVVKIISVFWHNVDNKLVVYTATLASIIVFAYLFHLLVVKLFKPGLKYCCSKMFVKEND